MGQTVGVLGSTEELGCWKDIRVRMRWTQGDVWVLERPIRTSKSYF